MVDMMHRTGSARVHFGTDATVLELPYGRDAYAMTIVLPREGTRVDDLVRGMDQAKWDGWIAGLREDRFEIALPRFRLEYETMMNRPLIALGMANAFGASGPVDFTGMSPRGHELVIGIVKQKTFVDVHEEGTEAAAVTAVGVRVVSAPAGIYVDRPFVVAIRERLSGTILFLGRISAPGL
jgi:serine protease inhibitor